MPLEINGMPFFAAPATRIDGFPAAITTDLGIGNDLSDKGTGLGFLKPWTQEEIENVAARAATIVDPSRRA
jgi:hypothetical protein